MAHGTKQLAKARKLLTDVQLNNFFSAEVDRPIAMRIMRKELAKNSDLDALFAEYTGVPEQRGLTLKLKVVRCTPRTYRISFGFQGGNAGDGGTWRVVFTAKGAVQRLVQEEWWLS